MKTVAFIFARGGSKGVPGKNVKLFAGKPLLAYSIETANKVPAIDRVFVSTDDQEIASVAEQWGATVIHRPTELAQDNSPEWLAWQHAVKWVEEQISPFDVFISLPATSPLRNQQDIQNCLHLFDETTDVVVTITATNRSPWFNMVRILENGYTKILFEGERTYSRRQDVPTAFDMTTVAYVSRPEFIQSASHIFDGIVKAVEIPPERAIDIDSLLDFKIAEYLYQRYHDD